MSISSAEVCPCQQKWCYLLIHLSVYLFLHIFKLQHFAVGYILNLQYILKEEERKIHISTNIHNYTHTHIHTHTRTHPHTLTHTLKHPPPHTHTLTHTETHTHRVIHMGKVRVVMGQHMGICASEIKHPHPMLLIKFTVSSNLEFNASKLIISSTSYNHDKMIINNIIDT